jgi:hypothetical protein
MWPQSIEQYSHSTLFLAFTADKRCQNQYNDKKQQKEQPQLL